MSDNKTKNAGGGEPPDQDPNQGQGGDGEELVFGFEPGKVWQGQVGLGWAR
jgi:hypothetical protein